MLATTVDSQSLWLINRSDIRNGCGMVLCFNRTLDSLRNYQIRFLT